MKMKGLPVTLVQCGLWKVSLTLTVHHRDTFSGRSRPRDGHRVFRDLYWAGRWQLLLSDLWHFHTVATMSQALCKWICGCCSVQMGAKVSDPRGVLLFSCPLTSPKCKASHLPLLHQPEKSLTHADKSLTDKWFAGFLCWKMFEWLLPFSLHRFHQTRPLNNSRIKLSN